MDPEEHARLYWCPAAGGWHITTHPPGDYDRKQVLSNGRNAGMTDPAVARLTRALDEHTSDWAKPIEPVTLDLPCPVCGQPITVKLGGGVREMKPGKLDPAAELVTLSVESAHHGHNRRDGIGMYVLTPE